MIKTNRKQAIKELSAFLHSFFFISFCITDYKQDYLMISISIEDFVKEDMSEPSL